MLSWRNCCTSDNTCILQEKKEKYIFCKILSKEELCISYPAFSGSKPAEDTVYFPYTGIFHIIAEFLRFHTAYMAACHDHKVYPYRKFYFRLSVCKTDKSFGSVSVYGVADFLAGCNTEPVEWSAVQSYIYD